MSVFKKWSAFFRKAPVQIAGVLLLLFSAGLLLWSNSINSYQATAATMAQVTFEGEYRIGEGEWQPIAKDGHISATRGDVTLRGNFHVLAPDGEYLSPLWAGSPIAFFANHISISILEEGLELYQLDHENHLFGVCSCGVDWTAYSLLNDSGSPIEIRIHNPHLFGNENAIDQLLSGFAFWSSIDFERELMNSSKQQRNIGLFFIIVSLVLLGTALFCSLLHVNNSRIIWLLGLTILTAGAYWVYSTPSYSVWNESIAANTTLLGFSMMFYMLFICGIITYFLQSAKPLGGVITTALGVADGVFFLLPLFTDMFFYDTWWIWVITQTLANAAFLFCLFRELKSNGFKPRLSHACTALLLLAFEADAVATMLGLWQGGFISKHVFVLLFVVALFVVLRIIPGSINTAAKAKELELQHSRLEAEKNIIEAELKESRISIMLSQIQPHFIYNTLGTIERMCLKDPQKAFDLVRNFSLYLRGNFSELDSVTPIRFAEEIKHVEYYVNIEKVRFPDMSIKYDLETMDFVLPALSVQPLVENAIKHGLMRLETGGTVVIRSYETPTHFCVEVTDDGVGFDVNAPVEGKKHVGLRNIRGRLKAMVNGELIIESTKGTGTRAAIIIPKEGSV